MTTGSIANLGAAMKTIVGLTGPKAMPPVERLALLLLADRMAAGAAMIDLGWLHGLLGTDDPSQARAAVEGLARRGHLLLSRWRDDAAYAGSTIATADEIAEARKAHGCDWQFENWTGAT